MTVRRGTLYVGVFLIATGAVTLGVAVGVLDPTAVADTVGALWPLAVIAVGVGLLLRRSPAALGAGVIAALLPGLALGASIAAASELPARWLDDAWTIRHAETRECVLGRVTAVDMSLGSIGSMTIHSEGACK